MRWKTKTFQTKSIKAAILCMLPYLVIPPYAAQAVEFCAPSALDVLGGEYQISNNVWGSNPGDQCITAYPNSTYFSVTTSTHDTSWAVQAYPFIFKGCHWGNCTTDSGLPIMVSDVVKAPFVWSVDPNGAGGKWNVAFEAWFSKTYAIATTSEPDGAELMIWLRAYGGMVPAGSKVATAVPIGGYNWDIYHLYPCPWGDWDHYIAYKITSPADYVMLDLKDFIDDSEARGWIDTSWYLASIEAGFELMVDGEGLTSNSFAGLINEVFSVDFIDFAYFANQWGRTDCNGANGWCDGADYPPEDGVVDLYDLEKFVDYWLEE